MIVVEQRLSDLFNRLPDLIDANNKPFKPVYHFGDGIEANEFIKRYKHAVYPLIYQTSLRETQNYRERTVDTTLEIVLCVQTRTDLLNSERWATTYKTMLVPLMENIMILFEKGGIIVSNFEYEIEKFPNYSQTESKDANAFIDIVDALRFRLPCEINDKCITKNIKF